MWRVLETELFCLWEPGEGNMEEGLLYSVAYPGIFFGWGGRGVQQIQLRTEDRGNGDLGTVAP